VRWPTSDDILVIEKYPAEIVIYIRNDPLQLTSIINKALAGIADEEKSAGSNKHKNQRRNKK